MTAAGGIMKAMNNEKGVALVTALMLTLVMLAICMTLLYMVTQSTKSSASQKRYSTAVAASYGGTEIIRDVIPRLLSYSSVGSALPAMTGFNNIGLAFPQASSDLNCLKQKLKLNPVGEDGLNAWTACSSANKTIDAKSKPDFTFSLNGLTPGQGYKVYSKIVNTVAGNSDMSGVDYLESGLGVAQAGGGVIAPQHFPSLFTIEVTGEKAYQAKERAELSVLYAY
jgi:hypothetical protein